MVYSLQVRSIIPNWMMFVTLYFQKVTRLFKCNKLTYLYFLHKNTIELHEKLDLSAKQLDCFIKIMNLINFTK